MSISLDSKGYKKLEVVYRAFLWGWGTGGRSEKALVAWDKMTAKTKEGGLGIEPFQQQSLILKMRWCSKILNDENVVWVKLAQESPTDSLDSGPGCKTRRWGSL